MPAEERKVIVEAWEARQRQKRQQRDSLKKLDIVQYLINSGQGNLATQLMGVDLSSNPSMPQSPNPSSLRPGKIVPLLLAVLRPAALPLCRQVLVLTPLANPPVLCPLVLIDILTTRNPLRMARHTRLTTTVLCLVALLVFPLEARPRTPITLSIPRPIIRTTPSPPTNGLCASGYYYAGDGPLFCASRDAYYGRTPFQKRRTVCGKSQHFD
eukprot:g79983.t1